MQDFKNQKVFIGGIQGSGKTVFARWLVKNRYSRAIGIRETKDFDDIPNMVLVERGQSDRLVAIEHIAKMLVEIGREVEEGKRTKHEFEALVIDEADLYFKSNFDIGHYMSDLVAMHRHYKIALVFITRRPQDIPAIIRESCRYSVYYKISGTYVMRALRDIHPDIPELIEQLDYDKHNFVLYELGRPPVLHKPVPLV